MNHNIQKQKSFSFFLLFLPLFFLLCSFFFLLSGCGKTKEADSQKDSASSSKLNVVTTFFAMEDFSKAVGGDKVQVSRIIPDGTEPHDFEPRVSDLSALASADIVVYNGLNMESWLDKSIASSENENLLEINTSSEVSNLISLSEGSNLNEDPSYDPHIWLSLLSAKEQITSISSGFSKLDPDNKDYYEKNAKDYIEKLDSLYLEYEEKFSSLDTTSFVTGHAAFQYFCRDFHLEQNSIEDVFAEGEPSAKQISILAKYCETNNINTIFSETLASPEISQTLAAEIGASVVEIHTLESNENNSTYLELMEDNCKIIYESLK